MHIIISDFAVFFITDKYTDIELHHKGTNGEPCTPKRYDKSFKFYVDQCNLQYCLPAGIFQSLSLQIKYQTFR